MHQSWSAPLIGTVGRSQRDWSSGNSSERPNGLATVCRPDLDPIQLRDCKLRGRLPRNHSPRNAWSIRSRTACTGRTLSGEQPDGSATEPRSSPCRVLETTLHGSASSCFLHRQRWAVGATPSRKRSGSASDEASAAFILRGLRLACKASASLNLYVDPDSTNRSGPMTRHQSGAVSPFRDPRPVMPRKLPRDRKIRTQSACPMPAQTKHSR